MDRILLFVKENIRLLLGGVVVIFAIVIVMTLILNGKKSTRVTVNDQKFNVTVAKTDKEQQVGLSNRKQLSKNQGMLFIFKDPDYYSFWMKDMKFPIDIIYISGDKVVTVIENAKPPSSSNENLAIYQPEEKSDKVLEVNAGAANKYKVKKGTTIKIENL
ncbi:MAG: hypothetical protein US51_C0004G0007 [Microgenomates group bacterium GW2011_GWA2_37_6]|nr:MAG: hypothetical protein US51_C0004G0007 [Microgenomates group bacterium GW2011_GWA2_37_6]